MKTHRKTFRFSVLILIGALVLFATWQLYSNYLIQTRSHVSYQTNIIKTTSENSNFRKVLFTGQRSQLVVMSIPPGVDVGEETHAHVEQTLFFLSGTGEGILGDKHFPIGPGDVVVVPPGTKHNFRNTGTEDLKIYTIYSPPNHIDGRVQATKVAADADEADEAFGQAAR